MVLEYIARQLQEVGLIRLTVAGSTALFMVSNAIMLYLLRSESFYKNIKKSNNVWFFIPPGVVDQYNNKERGQDPSSPKDSHTCPHKGPCWRYILKV
ncbi:unnamed protein product, partial [Timema podura]|nr:unnamed protein product [Timema podura]